MNCTGCRPTADGLQLGLHRPPFSSLSSPQLTFFCPFLPHPHLPRRDACFSRTLLALFWPRSRLPYQEEGKGGLLRASVLHMPNAVRRPTCMSQLAGAVKGYGYVTELQCWKARFLDARHRKWQEQSSPMISDDVIYGTENQQGCS